jgi:hypothetical protein
MMITRESISPHAELVCFQLMRAYVVEENDMTVPRAKTLLYIVFFRNRRSREASSGNIYTKE